MLEDMERISIVCACEKTHYRGLVGKVILGTKQEEKQIWILTTFTAKFDSKNLKTVAIQLAT